MENIKKNNLKHLKEYHVSLKIVCKFNTELRFQTFILFGFKHRQETQDERFYYFFLNRYVTHLHIWKD